MMENVFNSLAIKQDENELAYICNELEPIFKKIALEQEKALLRKDFRNYDNKYALMVSVKLQALLRKKPLLPEQQALNLYNNDLDYTRQKIGEIYDLVSYITVDNGIPYVIDKQTACAYLRMNISTYQLFFDNDLIEPDVANEFNSLEDFIISMYQQSAEGNLRNVGAVKYRLGLKNKFGGSEVEEVSSKSNEPLDAKGYDEKEVKARLSRDYNFQIEQPKQEFPKLDVIQEKPKKRASKK